MTGVTYDESSLSGTPPTLIIETDKKDIKGGPNTRISIPLSGEQGKIHAMQIALMTTSPNVINDAFDYTYDQILSEGGDSAKVSNLIGQNVPGFSDVIREEENGKIIYTAPIAGIDRPLESNSPYDLLQKVAIYNYIDAIRSGRSTDEAFLLENPQLEYLIRKTRQELTPKDIKENNFKVISALQQIFQLN